MVYHVTYPDYSFENSSRVTATFKLDKVPTHQATLYNNSNGVLTYLCLEMLKKLILYLKSIKTQKQIQDKYHLGYILFHILINV